MIIQAAQAGHHHIDHYILVYPPITYFKLVLRSVTQSYAQGQFLDGRGADASDKPPPMLCAFAVSFAVQVLPSGSCFFCALESLA